MKLVFYRIAFWCLKPPNRKPKPYRKYFWNWTETRISYTFRCQKPWITLFYTQNQNHLQNRYPLNFFSTNLVLIFLSSNVEMFFNLRVVIFDENITKAFCRTIISLWKTPSKYEIILKREQSGGKNSFIGRICESLFIIYSTPTWKRWKALSQTIFLFPCWFSIHRLNFFYKTPIHNPSKNNTHASFPNSIIIMIKKHRKFFRQSVRITLGKK